MITRLKLSPGIYLVGFMGSGKTTIGRLLADRLGWSFVDLDEEIEACAGQPIWQIFEMRGEAEFRRLEAEALRGWVRKIERGRPTVMALGGGAFVEPANCQLLREHGVTVWLNCPLETVTRRVAQASHRPLARDPEEFQRLYQQRQEAYSRADYRIAIESDDPVAAVEAILELPIF